jgi:hypothetical protein
MKSNKAFLFLTLVACLSLTSCSGVPKGNGGGGGGGGGGSTAKVSLTLVSETLPVNLGIISFKVAISSVKLTSASGVASTLNLGGLNNGAGLIVDLARAQSDSIFLGTALNVPEGTDNNATVTVALTGAELTFFNGTGATITSLTPQCPANTVCSVSFNVSGTPVITFSEAISGNTGIGLDFNLKNALTLTGTSLAVNLTNPGTNNILSAFALPRANNGLTAGQLDRIEDFTGIVSLVSPGVTITSSTAAGRGSISAATGTATVFDPDPSGHFCVAATSLSGCVSSNQAASMDAILNSDGTFTVQEIEPLLASPVVDTVEGTIVFINTSNQTQFSIITSDIIPAATNSKIGSLSLGDPLTVNLSSTVATGGFLVDTKGLPVGGALGNFAGGTTTAVLHLGQSVAVHVVNFTAASGTTAAIASGVDLVTLRWSRFIATVNRAGNPLFGIINLPGYFNFTSASAFDVQTFIGPDGITNLDGVQTDTSNLSTASPVAIRALFIEDSGNTLDPAFFAAKVRQP